MWPDLSQSEPSRKFCEAPSSFLWDLRSHLFEATHGDPEELWRELPEREANTEARGREKETRSGDTVWLWVQEDQKLGLPGITTYQSN